MSSSEKKGSAPPSTADSDPYSWIPQADQQDPHLIQYDAVGTTGIMRKMQHTLIMRINEPIQNAIDAADPGADNMVTIKVGLKKGDIPLVVTDEGPGGIMRFHGGQIMKFIEAVKAISTKDNRERKGIGMSQYVEIAPYVIIYTRSSKFMHRFTMIPNPNNRKLLAFCNVQNLEFTQENFKKYGLLKPGTRVEFHTKDDEPLKIDVNNLRKKLAERWSYRLYEHTNTLWLFVNGKRIEPLPEIIQHPPRFLCALKGGHKVWGAIWADPDGNGNCKLFVNGYLLEVGGPWGARQFRLYLNCNALATNPPRNEIIRNEVWDDLKLHIEPLIKRYPLSDEPKGIMVEKLKEFVKEHAARALGSLLPRIMLPVKGDNPNNPSGNTILDGFAKAPEGTANPNAVTGYVTPTEPQEGREIQTRVFKGRDPTHEGKIEETDDADKKGTRKGTKRKKKSKKDREPPFETLVMPYSPDKPLYIIQQHRPDSAVTIVVNTSNDELMVLANRKWATIMIGQWMGELKRYLETKGTSEACMDDEERMIYSRMRVEQWRDMGLYPSDVNTTEMTKKQLQAYLKREDAINEQ